MCRTYFSSCVDIFTFIAYYIRLLVALFIRSFVFKVYQKLKSRLKNSQESVSGKRMLRKNQKPEIT